MPSLAIIVPGSLENLTGGYVYDKRIAEGLRRHGWSVVVQELEGCFPFPSAAAREHAARVFADIPDAAIVLADGLALGALPDEFERESSRLRIVALVHLPVAAEVGIDADAAARLKASERRALATATRVIVTGRTTVAALAEYGIPPDRIAVVEPGTDRMPLARGSAGPVPQLLSVAALTPGKGHEILLRALAGLRHRPWHLTCAGSLDRHPPTVRRLRARLREDGLDDRVSLAGEQDAAALNAFYDRADLFVLATLHETYGMAVADALARGLAVISTTTGAIPALVGDDAGVLVPPGDVDALAHALSRVLDDARVRQRLAEGAIRARDRLPTWETAIDKMIAALEGVRR